MGKIRSVHVHLLFVAGVGLAVLVGCHTGEHRATTAPSGSHPTAVPAPDVLRGSILWKNLAVTKAVETYKDLAHVELVSDSRVKSVDHRIDLSLSDISTSEASKAIEKALLEQAGIVITHLDSNRVSVTYNDSLPISGPP